MRWEQASEAGRALVGYRWQNTSAEERSEIARELAESKWKRATKEKRKVEAKRQREIESELTNA
jgi:hypothetical protein